MSIETEQNLAVASQSATAGSADAAGPIVVEAANLPAAILGGLAAAVAGAPHLGGYHGSHEVPDRLHGGRRGVPRGLGSTHARKRSHERIRRRWWRLRTPRMSSGQSSVRLRIHRGGPRCIGGQHYDESPGQSVDRGELATGCIQRHGPVVLRHRRVRRIQTLPAAVSAPSGMAARRCYAFHRRTRRGGATTHRVPIAASRRANLPSSPAGREV